MNHFIDQALWSKKICGSKRGFKVGLMNIKMLVKWRRAQKSHWNNFSLVVVYFKVKNYLQSRNILLKQIGISIHIYACHSYLYYICFSYISNDKNNVLHFILNEFRLRLSQSSGILLFIELNLFISVCNPIFDLLFFLQRKCVCLDIVTC